MACCNNRADLNDISQETKNINACCNSGFKLNVYNWLKDIPEVSSRKKLVEVRFKNTRKLYFENVNSIKLTEGDVVAVESSPGHDIGTVSLVGELVYEQLRKQNIRPDGEFKKIYRKAKDNDIEKWKQAVDKEKQTMLRARQLASELKLNMKIGDVEFQGDMTKAIFYYIADERVDFRELIKRYAEEFKIRVEMKQIGVRQEAGRIGGIGPCGLELCCSKWMNKFVSVTTTSARHQELSLHPQKLAGQCGKLKCCLNYEVDVYKDAKHGFPNKTIALEVEDGTLHYVKVDVFKKVMWYSYDKNYAKNLTPIHVDRVREIIEMNIKGEKPGQVNEVIIDEKVEFSTVVGQESLTRFDNKNKPKNKKNNKYRKNKNNKSRNNNNNKKTNPNNPNKLV